MPLTVAAPAMSSTDERLHLPSRQAKASLDSGNKVHPGEWQPLASAMRRAIHLANLSDKEAAAEAGTTPQHLAMMLAGDKRPQSERFYASDVLRGPMLIALAEQTPGRFDVVTTITIRRTA